MNLIKCFSILFVTGMAADEAPNYLSVELGPAWQTKNDQRIPGTSGTTFSLSKMDPGPFFTYRLYAGRKFNNRHELRLLFAPLQFEIKGQFRSPVKYIGSDFAAETETTAFYKFNSYRLTYAYHFDPISQWELALGFTAKVRDAEVRLTQGNKLERKTNIGFVPLLHFQARRPLFADLFFRFDFDGLAAPQGRAFDAALFLERSFIAPAYTFFLGYRTVEGGANNDTVYNFAWFHYALGGVRASF